MDEVTFQCSHCGSEQKLASDHVLVSRWLYRSACWAITILAVWAGLFTALERSRAKDVDRATKHIEWLTAQISKHKAEMASNRNECLAMLHDSAVTRSNMIALAMDLQKREKLLQDTALGVSIKLDETKRLAESERNSTASSPAIIQHVTSPSYEMRATIEKNAFRMRVTNKSEWAWKNPEVEINPGLFLKGFYREKSAVIQPGETLDYPLGLFADRNGNWFDPSKVKVRSVSVKAKSPSNLTESQLYTFGD